jgi:hypothetical protein
MTADEKTITNLDKAMRYIKKLPPGTYFYFSHNGGLQLSATTQNDVKTIRSSFRGVIWKKRFSEYCQQWEYRAKTRTGVEVTISGVTEGPPACKMVEETVIEKRKVPVTYEEKEVEVKRVKYICPDGDKVTAQG